MLDWLPDWTTPEWAQVAGAFFAAVAAGAAWASVRHGQRIWRSSLLPALHVQGVFVSYGFRGERMRYVVQNAGGGLAKGTMFLFVEGDAWVCGALGDGFLQADEKLTVETAMERAKGNDTAIGVVMCRDTDETSWAWDMRGNRRPLQRWKSRWRRPVEPLSVLEVFQTFYPEVDLGARTQVGARTGDPANAVER
jgi:hypothetical protein